MNKPTHIHLAFNSAVLRSIALALVLVAGVVAQPFAITLDSNAIMGFETPAGWLVKGNGEDPTRGVSTTTRTQGSFALSLANAANQTTLTSLPVASTARALAGVGDAGAVFEVDVMAPAHEYDSFQRGSLKLFISSRSTGLNEELVGEADFSGRRLGIYSTLKFPIPDKVRNALRAAAFNDLTFHFMLNSPEDGGRYLFDNLRVHSVPLMTAGNTPPAGYGGSVDLVAIGAAPVAQLFNIGAVQVPDNFHLKLGSTDHTTVRLALGFDGAPAFTCDYHADSSDPNDASYILTSCTNGVQPGDLVAANWAQLTIEGGSPALELRAQLARNPIGDLMGGGILPPMPTFWGDFDGCVPKPVAGTVVTTSPACANQTAQASQIVTAYFNKVQSSNPAPNWIVTPSPEFARRHGDASPQNKLLGVPPPPNDPPFDDGRHLNQGGDFDAYWRLSGDLSTTNTSTQDTAHLDATLGAHAVLFGKDVDVVSIRSVIDTSSGAGTYSTCQGMKNSPDGIACFDVTLFGNDIPVDSFEGSKGFNVNYSQSQDLDLPPIQIWIFSIKLGATASLGLDVTGTLAVTGFRVIVTPSASLGAHIFGGVNLVIASGGVDASVSLLKVSTPITADAEWSINTHPQSCSARLDFSLNGQLTVSSGGGEVDLVASFGPCPFCYKDSWKLFDWGPILSSTETLFDFPITDQTFPLPVSLCSQPLNVTINSPTSTVISGFQIPLEGTIVSPDAGAVNCNAFQWTVNAPDTLSPPSGQGCNVSAKFMSQGPRTLTLSAVDTITDQFGRTITETGSATETLNVTPLSLPPGVYIMTTIPAASLNPQPPLNGDILHFGTPLNPLPIQLSGAVVGLSGVSNISWTAKGNNTPLVTIGTGLNVTWNAVSDVYTVTMTATDSHGNVVGTPATMTAVVNFIH
jgi:hypothetical protein